MFELVWSDASESDIDVETQIWTKIAYRLKIAVRDANGATPFWLAVWKSDTKRAVILFELAKKQFELNSGAVTEATIVVNSGVSVDTSDGA